MKKCMTVHVFENKKSVWQYITQNVFENDEKVCDTVHVFENKKSERQYIAQQRGFESKTVLKNAL